MRRPLPQVKSRESVTVNAIPYRRLAGNIDDEASDCLYSFQKLSQSIAVSPSRPCSSLNSAAFSLLELFVVMAVIALIIGIGMPAVVSLSKSRNLTSGGNRVMGLAQQARQNSVAKNSLTALVLASQVEDARFNLRLFCLMELAPGAIQWTALSPWEILPDGVAADSGSGSATFFQSPKVTPAIQNLRFQGKAVLGVVYQIFNPDGSLYVGSNGQPVTPPIVKLVQGTIASGGILQYTATPNGGPGNYYAISLNLFTGIPQGLRP